MLEKFSWLQSLSGRNAGTSTDTTFGSSVDDDASDDWDDSLSDHSFDMANLGDALPSVFAIGFMKYLRPLPAALARDIARLIYRLYASKLFGFDRPVDEDDPEGSRPPKTIPTSHTPGNTSQQSKDARKRPSDNNGSPGRGGGDPGSPKRPKMGAPPACLAQNERGWACPFYARDPEKYCAQGEFADYRRCSRSPGFQSDVHRVKYAPPFLAIMINIYRKPGATSRSFT
jgi:hypothetical protein